MSGNIPAGEYCIAYAERISTCRIVIPFNGDTDNVAVKGGFLTGEEIRATARWYCGAFYPHCGSGILNQRMLPAFSRVQYQPACGGRTACAACLQGYALPHAGAAEQVRTAHRERGSIVYINMLAGSYENNRMWECNRISYRDIGIYIIRTGTR